MSVRIDEEAEEAAGAAVAALIANVKAAGLEAEADMFLTVYSAWLRTIGAYRWGLAELPDDQARNFSVTNFTIRHWSPLIPGTPVVDVEAARRYVAADEAWHVAEDRRMREDAGEFD